jgi:hypothetical protein
MKRVILSEAKEAMPGLGLLRFAQVVTHCPSDSPPAGDEPPEPRIPPDRIPGGIGLQRRQ